MAYECNDNMHKFGPYVKDSENNIYRKCMCCGRESYYPNDDDIRSQLKTQDDTGAILGVLLDNNTDVIQSSDDYMGLVACLFDNLGYLFINIETQELFRKKMSVFNDFFNKNEEKRYQLINSFIEYLGLHFKKENMEIRFGRNSFPEEEEMLLDEIFDSVRDGFDMEMEKLFEKRNEKNHLVNR